MNETTIPLPPKRDLDPHRHSTLRADLVADIRSGDKHRSGLGAVPGGRDRPWIMPVTAAAAVVLLAVGIGAGVRSASPPARPAPPAAAPVDQLTRDCRAAARTAAAGYAEAARRAGWAMTTDPDVVALLPRLRVINSVRDGAGTYAVLRYRGALAFCRAERGATPPAVELDRRPFTRPVNWLVSRVAVHVTGRMVMGVSTSDVRKIAITASPGHVDQVVPLNGTWIAPNRFGQAPGVKFRIRGYDRHGAMVYDSLSAATKQAALAPCVRAPDGEVIFFPQTKPGTSNCAEAIAWP